jgi:F0F1-type ATP synthase membrane subunit b/b'
MNTFLAEFRSFFWWALNLTVFLFLIAKYVATPILGFLDSAQGGIDPGELEQAKEKLAQAETLKADVLERLETRSSRGGRNSREGRGAGTNEAAQHHRAG